MDFYQVYSNKAPGAKNGPTAAVIEAYIKSTFSEYCHVAYQIKGNEAHNDMLANIPPYSHTIDPDGVGSNGQIFERSSMYLDMELRQVKGKITRHIAKEIAKHSEDGTSHWTDVLDRLCIDLSMEEEEKIGEK